MLLGNKSYTVGKPVYFPFKWCHICKEHAFVGWAAQLSMWVAPKMCQNSPILLLVFTLVLSCLLDWMIELSISNREQTRNIGNFTLYSFNTPSGREWNGLPWVQTSTQLNTFGISLGVLYVLVTNTTTMADLQRLLVEEWNAIPQQCVTRLVTSMRRWCQAVVAAYGSSTRSWGCIKWIKCKIANMSCLFLVTDREFNHPIHQTTQNKSEYQHKNKLFSN